MTKSTGDCIEKASLNGLKASSTRSKGMDVFLLDRRERRTYRYRRTFVPQLTQSRRYTTHGTTTGYIITICYWTLLLLADKHPSKDPPIHYAFLRNFSWVFLPLLLSRIPLSTKFIYKKKKKNELSR